MPHPLRAVPRIGEEEAYARDREVGEQRLARFGLDEPPGEAIERVLVRRDRLRALLFRSQLRAVQAHELRERERQRIEFLIAR